jgi:hypothetical protein
MGNSFNHSVRYFSSSRKPEIGKKKSLSTPWRCMGEANIWLHSFLNSVLVGGDWLASWFGILTQEKGPIGHPLNKRLSGHRGRSGHFACKGNRTANRPGWPNQKVMTWMITISNWAIPASLKLRYPISNQRLTGTKPLCCVTSNCATERGWRTASEETRRTV